MQAITDTMLRIFALFLPGCFKSKLLRLMPKTEHPLAGVSAIVFFVELAGVEPASRQGDHMLSTCLSCLDCRE